MSSFIESLFVWCFRRKTNKPNCENVNFSETSVDYLLACSLWMCGFLIGCVTLYKLKPIIIRWRERCRAAPLVPGVGSQTGRLWTTTCRPLNRWRARDRIRVENRIARKSISTILHKTKCKQLQCHLMRRKTSRGRDGTQEEDDDVQILLETKETLSVRVDDLSRFLHEALDEKKSLKKMLGECEQDLNLKDRDAQRNWIQWQATQRNVHDTKNTVDTLKERLHRMDDVSSDLKELDSKSIVDDNIPLPTKKIAAR